jgi:hypothetical protein
MDDLVNKIESLGRRFNKSMPLALLKIEAEKIRDFCEELLARLPK